MPLTTDPIMITDKAFDAETALSQFRRSCGDVGAIVSFTGIVRGEADVLSLSHYPGFTEAEIQRICEAALERWDVSHYKIIHRVGAMLPGEVIVFVAVASSHRRAAFEAVDLMMDHLKSDVPFWKKETSKGETRWIEPRGQDKSDMKRWSDNGRS